MDADHPKMGGNFACRSTLWHLASYDDQIDRRYLKLEFDEVSPVRDERLLRGIIYTLCAEVGIAAPKEPELIDRLTRYP